MLTSRVSNSLILVLFLNVLGAAPAVYAQEMQSAPAAGSQKQKALSVFESAMSKMMVGLFDRACEEFGESYRLDPLPNTLFALAECEAGAGRHATAARRYEQYIQVFGRMPNEWKALQNGRDQVAAQRAKELRAQASQVTIALPPGIPSGTTVQLDGTTLSLDGGNTIEDVAVDPGDHSLRIGDSSGAWDERNFSVSFSEHKRLDIWGSASPMTFSSAEHQPPAPSPDTIQPAPSPTPWAAYIVGGIGLASIAGGLTAAFIPSDLGDYRDAAVGIPIAVGVFGVATSAALFWMNKRTASPESTAASNPVKTPKKSIALNVQPGVSLSVHKGASISVAGNF